MKKLFILSLIALSSVAANAQDCCNSDSVALSPKEIKAKKAAALKAFKAKQKEELAAFIANQEKGGCCGGCSVELKTKEDSVANIYGTALSRGLKEYATMQLGVDSTKLNEFAKGILDNVKADNSDPSKKAYNVGNSLGSDIANKTMQFGKEYFAADPDQQFNTAIVATALVKALLGKSEIEPEVAGQQLNDIMQQRKVENDEKMYGPIREEGEKFLAENKSKEGVITTASGLQYKVLTAGTGAVPTKTDKVKVQYEGKLLDGTVFDSSYQRNQPATFGVTQVIKGWTEALQLMPVGSKWELYIPYQLAYGERGSGSNIKPYSMLIFTVELLDIEAKKEAQPADTKTAAKTTAKTSAKKK